MFTADLEPDRHGYCIGDKLFACSRPSLIENVKSDKKKLISLVWTPDTDNLVAPEEIAWLIDALHTREKSYYQQAFKTALFNVLIWGWLFYDNLTEETAVRQIMLFNWLAIAVIPAIEHGWGLYQCRIKTQEVLIQRSQQNRYSAWVKNSSAPWSKLLTGCISLVAAVQVIVFFIPNINSSIETAGVVKPLIWKGEIWRLLTGTLLHGNLIHFMFNIFAIYVLSKLVEITTHRIYVPIVFIFTALCGSIASLLLIPDVTSVGASGGIMGLLGFLFVTARNNQHLFPQSHQKMLLKGAIYTLFAGLLAYRVIDNPAHIGGFLGGILLAWLLIRNRQLTIPIKQVSRPLEIIGIISANAIAMTALLAIFQMIQL